MFLEPHMKFLEINDWIKKAVNTEKKLNSDNVTNLI